MKHSSTRSLFDYWNEKRRDRPAPERADIEPAAIRHALGDTFMLAADFVDQLRFRLAGTRVCALFCRELKGEEFTALWDEDSRARIDDVLAAVNDEADGAVAGVTGRAADGQIDLEFMVLPLAHIGHARVRAIGTLTPLVPFYWLGEKPIVTLTLGTVRHIGSGLETVASPMSAPSTEPVAAIEDVRVRHGFVVYSGGRETPPGKRTG